MKIIKNKYIKYSIISFSVLLLIYFSMSMFFRNHFYFGTIVNGINVSGKTVEDLDKEIGAKTFSYTLELEERGNIKEEIKAEDIKLKYDGKDKSQALKDSQNSKSWILSLFKSNKTKMDNVVTYDETLLKEKFEKLSCLDSKNIVEPKDAYFAYTNSGYHIIKEINGNKIKKDILYSNIVNSILTGDTKIILEDIKCYEAPIYTEKSEKINETKKYLDKYIASQITYTFNGGKKVIDSEVINNWIIIDGDLVITFNESKIKIFVSQLASNYNTFGKKRDFITSLGTTVKVGGGNYGWIVNVNKEISEIISIIKEGQTVNREPIYSQTAASRNINDLGDTYVEINLAMQHLWFYKNGFLVTEGDVVTGNTSKNNGTPTGIYRLNYKEKNATLDGEDYSVPVSFWMPFNGNIGIHDATWRKTFGGEIYIKNGSHGCINAPYYLANKIFDNIISGTPVVCYYLPIPKVIPPVVPPVTPPVTPPITPPAPPTPTQ